jgi:hypothetical protein
MAAFLFVIRDCVVVFFPSFFKTPKKRKGEATLFKFQRLVGLFAQR